jgi:hypothetical protein
MSFEIMLLEQKLFLMYFEQMWVSDHVYRARDILKILLEKKSFWDFFITSHFENIFITKVILKILLKSQLEDILKRKVI